MQPQGLVESYDSPRIPLITLAEAKLHLRVDFDADDEIIEAMVEAATTQAEAYCNAAFLARDFAWTFPCFPPCRTFFPRNPVLSLTSFQYLDPGDSPVAYADVPAATYVLTKTTRPGMITLADGQTWPTAAVHPEAIKVEFRAGMAETAAGVPQAIKIAVKLLLGHLYEQREVVIAGTTVTTVPYGFEEWLNPYRFWGLAGR